MRDLKINSGVLSFLPKMSFAPVPNPQEAFFRPSGFLNDQWVVGAVYTPWSCLVGKIRGAGPIGGHAAQPWVALQPADPKSQAQSSILNFDQVTHSASPLVGVNLELDLCLIHPGR